jgi:hypothetical protein
MGLCESREEEDEGVRLATADTDALIRSLGTDGKCVLLKVLLLGSSGYSPPPLTNHIK